MLVVGVLFTFVKGEEKRGHTVPGAAGQLRAAPLPPLKEESPARPLCYYRRSALSDRRQGHQPPDNSLWPLYKVTNDQRGPAARRENTCFIPLFFPFDRFANL